MGTIIKIQRKGQVTIPTRLRIQVGLADGDFVEAKAEGGRSFSRPSLLLTVNIRRPSARS
jgi:AbrB family looped-hinge helix DNA binding protein